jgi:hypothetical protein
LLDALYGPVRNLSDRELLDFLRSIFGKRIKYDGDYFADRELITELQQLLARRGRGKASLFAKVFSLADKLKEERRVA